MPLDFPEAEQVMKAQRIVGAAMGWCLSVWFAPFVSGLLCNEIEQRMVRDALTALGADASDTVVDTLFWCCRKKLLFLNAATYIPYAGTSFQLLEVYALGQFTIHSATHYFDLADERHLSESWGAIQRQVFAGDRVVMSYEEFTGNKFPDAIKSKFVPAVNLLRNAYILAESVPGVRPVQDIAGEGIRRAVKRGKKILLGTMKWALGGGG